MAGAQRPVYPASLLTSEALKWRGLGLKLRASTSWLRLYESQHHIWKVQYLQPQFGPHHDV
jgi:hypothetical protein